MKQREIRSSKCNFRGDFGCGICACHEGFFGHECQYITPKCPTPGVNCTDCINPITKTICTEQGECPDNHCVCKAITGGTIDGKWCQCNTQDCWNAGEQRETDRGICSNHGVCQCSKEDARGISTCKCDHNYGGKLCDCPVSDSSCKPDGDGRVCSGNGKCKCGKCVCTNSDEWTGVYCDVRNCEHGQCANCAHFASCVECKFHSDDPASCEKCDININDHSANVQMNPVKFGYLTNETSAAKLTDPNVKLCSAITTQPNEPRCKFYYTYEELSDGKIKIQAEDGKHCRLDYSLLIILWAVLIALLIGLIFLCCWRVCVFCVDREKKYATVAYLVEFIKAKYHVKRSQGVACIPVRRSVFDGPLKIAYRTFPGNVSDDIVKVLREGEQALQTKSSQNTSKNNNIEMETLIRCGEPDWGSGEIEWQDGEEMVNINIDVKNTNFEGTETAFWIELQDPPNEIHFGRRRCKVLVIRDDDPGSIGFLKSTYVFKESDMLAVVPIHRTNGSDGLVTVDYNCRDMTAENGTHYRQRSGTITLDDGELSKEIEVELIQDSCTDCQDKAFNLELTNPSGGALIDRDSCLVRILFDETSSVVQFVRQAYPFLENCTYASVPVIRTRSTKGISTVQYATRDITAKAGVDYEAIDGIITFANDETEKTIDIKIIENQDLIEEGRTFRLELFEPSDGTKVGRNSCEIKIIEDDDPGRFELVRNNYVFKCGSQATEIPIIRSMGADGRVEVPWEIVSLGSDRLNTLPAEAQLSGTVTFENMIISGNIELNFDVDWEEDVSVLLKLLPPSNNARLGGIQESTLNILGKGRFDEIKMSVPNIDITRGQSMSPAIVNFERIIRAGQPGNPLTTVVMFETMDDTATEQNHDYYGVKKAVIFSPKETLAQVQIHVNDEYDEDKYDNDIFFNVKMTPVSDHVTLKNPLQKIGIVNPIDQNELGRLAAKYGAKISFAQQKYLCRMSERTCEIEIKRQGKEDKEVGCAITSERNAGNYIKPEDEKRDTIVFPAHSMTQTFRWEIPAVESKQLVTFFHLSDFGINSMEGSIPTCEVTVINDVHAGTIGFPVPEMTYRVTDLRQEITLLRAGGRDGIVHADIYAVDGHAENGVHYQIPSPKTVTFENGEHEKSFEVEFLPGNHGKMISRNFQLEIRNVTGSGKIGQSTCLVQLVTDQSPCSVSFAKAKFSFLANSGDQGVPLLRTGANENSADIEWQLLNLPDECPLDQFPTSGMVTFGKTKNRAMLKIPSQLIDVAVNDKFDISIRPAPYQMAVSLGDFSNATISIISGAEHGKFEFLKTRQVCKQNEGSYELPVIRQGGSDGVVEVKYEIKSKLECYDGIQGVLTFAEGVFEQNILLEINSIMASDTDTFIVLLTEASIGSIGTRDEANISVVKESKELEFEFATDYLATRIGDITADIDIIVKGDLEDRVSLRFTTQPETAVPGQHYLTKSEQVLFKPGDQVKQVQIGLLEAPLEEPVTLTLALLVADGPGRIGTKNECLINIPPAGHPGQISFTKDFMEVNQSEKVIQLQLCRARGSRGALLCPWSTFGENWYHDASGQIMFEDGQNETVIDFALMAQPTDEPYDEFRIDLRKPNGQAELGAMPSMTIRVRNDIPGGTIQFATESSEILAQDGDRTSSVAVVSDGRNRVPFELSYQLTPSSVLSNPDIALELENSFSDKTMVPAGVCNVLLEIPICYLPSGETQEFFCKLLTSNRGARIGKLSMHKIRVSSAKRQIGFTQTAVTAKQSRRELVLAAQRTVSLKEALIVPWIAYTTPEPVKGVLTYDDGQEFEDIRIPFKQVYVSGNPLSESFDVEINPGADYDLRDNCNICNVTLENDLGPGIIEFLDNTIKQLQSNGHLALRLIRHERTLEEATVKWRIHAKEGSIFKGTFIDTLVV